MHSEECWFRHVSENKYVLVAILLVLGSHGVIHVYDRIHEPTFILVFDCTDYNLFGNSSQFYPNRYHATSHKTMPWNIKRSTYYDHIWCWYQVCLVLVRWNQVYKIFSFGCFISSTLYEMLPVKILLLIVGLVDATGFIGLCFWKGEPFTYFVIIAVTAGMGFTGGVFESIIPSKSKNRQFLPSHSQPNPYSAI